MHLYLGLKTRRGQGDSRIHLAGWADDKTGPLSEPAEITLACDGGEPVPLLRLALEPRTARLSALATGGSLHFFRLADATLRVLPPEAQALEFERGDAYIAVTPGAARLVDGPAIARFLHLRDSFNAERLAGALLDFLGQESGRSDIPMDIAALVVEAR